MHPRNPYIEPPNFCSLADTFPPLKPFVSVLTTGKYVIDFKNSQAQRTLTQALLKKDFGLTLDIPEDRLCPPVPNRLNYILWIQDILSIFPDAGLGASHKIRGLDIGTGASAIYPLLGCSLPENQNWTFVGTEIDLLSCKYATRNVVNNNLSSRIKIYPIPRSVSLASNEAPYDGILAPLLNDPTSRFDFTMCNPPFYGSTTEIEQSAEAKEAPPNGVCTGAETEMVTPGGETSFVSKMIHESSRENVRERCRWFTSMLGKLSSVGEVITELRNSDIDNYIVTQFVQGATRRWAIGWSFGVDRLPDSLARSSELSPIPFLPLPTTLRQNVTMSFHEVKVALSQVLTSMDSILYHFHELQSGDTVPWTVMIEAKKNTWSRSARRKRKREGSPIEGHLKSPVVVVPDSVEATSKAGSANATPPASHPMVCRLSPLPLPHSQTNSGASVTLEAQWIKGDRRSMFEGFWSHVCRKLKAKEQQNYH